jgi:hypothetical protein
LNNSTIKHAFGLIRNDIAQSRVALLPLMGDYVLLRKVVDFNDGHIFCLIVKPLNCSTGNYIGHSAYWKAREFLTADLYGYLPE